MLMVGVSAEHLPSNLETWIYHQTFTINNTICGLVKSFIGTEGRDCKVLLDHGLAAGHEQAGYFKPRVSKKVEKKLTLLITNHEDMGNITIKQMPTDLWLNQ